MKCSFGHFSSNITANALSHLLCFFYLVVRVSALPCRATLAFSAGESFTVVPATPWSANMGGRSGFPADAQRSRKTAKQEKSTGL